MKKNVSKIILLAIVVAVAVVAVLKLMGQDNATVMGGAVAGGVVGGIVGAMAGSKKS
ncbi:MAG: hypothetical protein ABJM06_11385 [Gilvibacter sp.]